MCDQPEQLPELKLLLTIAIPTFNRARFLLELLTTLADQLENEPRVELLISDNASVDETPLVIQNFVKDRQRIRYLRNSENIGAEANFVQCFEKADGKYVWIIGDDDVLESTAIAMVLSYLQLESYDLIHIDHYAFSGSPTPKNSGRSGKPLRVIDPAEFARHGNVFLTFISANIMNRQSILANSNEPISSLIGTNLVQLGWLYTALNAFKLGLVIPDRLIGMRVNNTGGYKLLEVFGPTFKRITEQRLHSASTKRAMINGILQRFWPGILLLYRTASDRFESEALPQEVLSPVFGSNFRYWCFAYPVITLPLGFARFWMLMVRVINRLDKSCKFILLR